MKTITYVKAFEVCVVLFAGAVIRVEGAEAPVAAQVAAKPMFPAWLVWIGGQEPPEAESVGLLRAINTFESNGATVGLAAFEEFLSAHPQSAWGPSLHMNLAKYYQDRARYTPALAHWEAAWNGVKASKDLRGQQMAVRTVAGWSGLLAGLGHKDELSAVFKELDALRLPFGSYASKIERARVNLALMTLRPGESFRCGAYALGHLAQAMNLETKPTSKLFRATSPDGGFRVAQVLALAESYGIGLDAVRRPAGSGIVVPSIVHWKQNHYATIVEKKGDRYVLMDSALGLRTWVDAETINTESSGVFLVPKGKAPADWGKLSPNECTDIYGTGYAQIIPDDEDDNCGCDSCDDDDEDRDQDIPAATDGDPGPGDCGPLCEVGMPRWSVSEPYINLWLKDVPLFYRRPNGNVMKLRLTYKQRNTPKENADQMGGFGPQWECNWLGMMWSDSSSPDTYVQYRGSGGTRQFNTDGSPEYKSGLTMQCTRNGTPIVKSRDGWAAAYGPDSVVSIGGTNYLYSQALGQFGVGIVWCNHETIGRIVRLTNVVDREGRSCTLNYTNATYTNLITSVTDPYGRCAFFKYDGLGRLAQIVDMQGMTTTFKYDSDNVITNLTTPYGSTTFKSITGTNIQYNDPQWRALLITEASGDQQLYQYCGDGPGGVCGDGYSENRNSWHWNRSQYAAIAALGITDILNMPDSYYGLASTKHWLHGHNTTNDMMTVSDTLDAQAGPLVTLPRQTVRATTTNYKYQGQTISSEIGTRKRVAGIWNEAGKQTVSVDRNDLGRPTTITYFVNGSDGTKSVTTTNTFDQDGRRLLTVYGPSNVLVRGYGYHPIITNLLTSVTNALNQVIRYTYDTNTIRVTSVTFPGGLVRTNIYYDSGSNACFLRAQIDLGVKTNSFGYQNGNLTAETNELGLVKTYLYDNLNRLVCTTFPDATTISNCYDKLDVVGVKDRMGQWTHYGYNSVRQLMAVTNVNGQVTQYEYCNCGSPSLVTHWNGSTPVVTQYYHDVAGHMTNVVYPDGYQLFYTYNLSNMVSDIADQNGYHLEFGYASIGQKYKLQKTTRSCPTGSLALASLQYDEYGRVTNSLDRNNVYTAQAYDYLDRLVSRQSHGAYNDFTGVESFLYDDRGLATYTNALGQPTSYVRDAAGRVLYETNANNEVLKFTYNPAGDLLTLIDGKNQTTSWNYDTYGRVTNKVDAANNMLFAYQYDPLDRLTNRWSAAKSNTVYKYDPLGSLTNVVYLSTTTSNIVFRYDDLNRLTTMVDGAGATAFTWTPGDQLAGEDGPWSMDTVSYTYNNRLRAELNLQAPNASPWVQSYGYDGYIRLADVVSPAGSFHYEHTQGDKLDSLQSPNAQITMSYDSLARLTEMDLSWSSVLNIYGYGYDSGSQRTKQVFTVDNGNDSISMTNIYTYDKIGQLRTAKGIEQDGTPRLHEQFGYAYDQAGNLEYRTNNALIQTFNVDTRNQLTSAINSGTLTVAGTATEPKKSPYSEANGVLNVTVSGTGLSSGAAILYADGSWARTNAPLTQTVNTYTATAQDSYGRQDTSSVTVSLPASKTFLYDLNGNLRTNSTRIYDYDDENQLIRVTEANAWKSEFSYDGMMRRRVRKEYTWSSGTGNWVLTNEVHYVYDGKLVIQERDANNLPQVTYTRGEDLSGSLENAGGIGGLLARTDNGLLAIGDSRASAYYHCDGNGNVTALMNAYGFLVAQYEYDPFGNIITMSGPLVDANLYRFSSKEWHPNSGLVYYGFRFYSPSLQRWPNRDPIGENGGFNLYGFAANDSINALDSDGRGIIRDIGKGLAGPGKLCTDKSCKKDKCKDKAKRMPEDSTDSTGAWKKDPWKDIPDPGECADADAVATSKGILQIHNGTTCTIRCNEDGSPKDIVCKKRVPWSPDPTPNPPGFPPNPITK